MTGNRRWLVAAAAGYLLLTVAYFRPTPHRLATAIVSDAGDPLLNTYLMEWVAHSAERGFTDLWNPPIFHPTRGALAFADHMIGPGLLTALLPAHLPRGLLTYNLLLLLSYPLAATFTAWVLRRGGATALGAWIGGLAFAFSPYRWMALSHLQVLLAQWIPLLLWLWDRLLGEPRPRRAAAFLGVYACHLAGGAYLAYMVHVPLLAIAWVRTREHGRALCRPPALRVLLPTLAAAAGLVATFFVPYLLVSRRLGLERTAAEAIGWGATTLSYLTPSTLNLYAGAWLEKVARPENHLFAGFLPTALAGCGLVLLLAGRTGGARSRGRRLVLAVLLLVALGALAAGDVATLRHGAEGGPDPGARLGGYGPLATLFAAATAAWLLLRRRWRDPASPATAPRPAWDRGLLLGAFACALLSLPLVFVPLREVVPGLSGMRVPARFYPFVSLAIAYLAAGAVGALTARRSAAARRVAGTLLTVALAVELAPQPMHWDPVPDRAASPPPHRWLAAHHGEVHGYLELPVADDSAEIAGMYLQSAHWVPLANGYSGYFPRRWNHLRDCCAHRFVGAAELDTLRAQGITHLVVSPWKQKPWQRSAWRAFQRRLVREGLVRQRFAAHGGAVLEILDAAGRAQARAERGPAADAGELSPARRAPRARRPPKGSVPPAPSPAGEG